MKEIKSDKLAVDDMELFSKSYVVNLLQVYWHEATVFMVCEYKDVSLRNIQSTLEDTLMSHEIAVICKEVSRKNSTLDFLSNE